MARAYVDQIECADTIVIPGNHDSRNVGYVHFEELFGTRSPELHKGGVSIVAVDSSEPDLDYGQIGRNRYHRIEGQFARPADLRVTSVVTQPQNFSGEETTVTWTVTNQGADVWRGTQGWLDGIYISKDPTFIAQRWTR